MKDTISISESNSSLISQTKASLGVSLASSFSPGNSQYPPKLFPSGRWAQKIFHLFRLPLLQH